MNHADVRKHLADYLEGDLALENRALVDAHLDHCEPCSTEVEEMLQTIRLLRTMPEPEIPPMIAANVMRRIRAGESRPGFFQRFGRAVSSILEPTFVLPASAIAVAALVVTVTQGTFTQPTLTGSQPTGSQPTGTQPTGTQPTGTQPNGLEQRAAALPSLMSPYSDSRSDGRGEAKPSGVGVASSRSAVPRTIRLRVDGSGVARLSMSRRAPVRRSPQSLADASEPVFTSAVPEAWAAEFSRVMYGNNTSSAAGRLVSAERFAPASDGLTRSVARSQPVAQDRMRIGLESDGADPRDAWLTLGFEDPAEFAQYIARQNLAEQELWAARLSERAEARGLLTDFLRALRESGDETAAWVADDFAAQAIARSDRESSGGEASTLP